MKVAQEDEDEEVPEWRIILDCAELLRTMTESLLARLPRLGGLSAPDVVPEKGLGTLRGDVVEMIAHYVSGQQEVLRDLIEDLSNDLLSGVEVPDWYNKAGGYGTLEWRVNPGGDNTLCGTVNQCVEEYDTTVLCYNGSGEVTTIDHQGRSN